MKVKNASKILLCLFLMTICCSVLLSCEFLRKERERDFGVPIELVNKTNDDMLVIIFPIVISQDEILEESSIKQIQLEKGGSKLVRDYLGKNVNLENVIICAIAWRMDSDERISPSLIQEKPYLQRTFYSPKFEIGPEKYGIFATVVIE